MTVSWFIFASNSIDRPVDPDTSDGMQCTDLLINIREKGPLNLKAETYVEGGGSEGGVVCCLVFGDQSHNS